MTKIPLITGAKTINVPGEIAGFYTAWQKFGKMPWKDLFQPVIKMCKEGFKIDASLAFEIEDEYHNIRRYPEIKYVLLLIFLL